MLKEAIEKIEEMSALTPFCIDGHTYIRAGDDFVEVRPQMDAPDAHIVTSLDALVHLIKDDTYKRRLFVSVMTADMVDAFGQLEEDRRWRRLLLYRAKATDIPGWGAEVRLPFDQASVALMTRFQDSPDREYALRLLAQITTGAKVTYTDNGIASTIVMQKGAALAENMTIRPLVRLRPYRTFQEVEQPEGIFLIRIDERGITFTEADGGMWRLTARNTVKAWLEKELADRENVTVML